MQNNQPVFDDNQRKWLAECRQLHFVQKQFECQPSLRLRHSPHLYGPYTRQKYDPEKYEVCDGEWDHEHCLICSAGILTGDFYWQSIEEEETLLCSTCYKRMSEI